MQFAFIINFIFRVIELKGHLRLEKENNDDNLYEKMKKSAKRQSSKSREREKSRSLKQ